MPANVLFERDTNVPQTNAATADKTANTEKPKSLEYHRQVLESKMRNAEQQQTYVSPSDNIQSPATQKLAALKGKRLEKNIKPKASLFARTAAKNAEAKNRTGMFEDISPEQKPLKVEDSPASA